MINIVTARITKIDNDDNTHQFMFILSSDSPTKPIAGHRFVDLLGKSRFANDTDLLLDLYGLSHTPPNIYLDMGVALEEPIIKYVFANKEVLRFPYEEYKECKSGAFDLDELDVGGLPDGVCIEDEELIEVKTTVVQEKDIIKQEGKPYREEWELQAQYYLWLWNKKKGLEHPLKRIRLIKYYVPRDILEAHIKYPNYIIGKNVKQFVFEPRENMQELYDDAKKKKEELLFTSAFLVEDKENKSLFYQLKKAMNSKKLKLEYNKEDEDTYKFVRKIYLTKVGRKKRKKSTKGKVKIK